MAAPKKVVRRKRKAPDETPAEPIVHPTKSAAPKPQFAKAAEFAKEVERLGWKVEKTAKGDRAEVIATRGAERIHIAWVNNVYERWAGYTYGGGPEKRVPNAKSAIVLMQRPESVAATEGTKVRKTPGGPSRKVASLPKGVAVDTSVKYELPWGEDATDEEVMDLLKGKRVIWRMPLHGDHEHALVDQRIPRDEKREVPKVKDGKPVLKDGKPVMTTEMQPPRHLKVERNKDGDRVITFAGDHGFRSFNENWVIGIG